MKNNNPYVISVGNLSMGGTGKTPHTIAIANHFINKGEKVAILSRGYKGKIGYDTHVISNGEKILIEPPYASDEPYMMALNVPQAIVITGKLRSKSLELAIKDYNITMAILDDGFQHKSVKKDKDIVLLDYKNPISTGFPVPFGYLREFPSALKRADIIVFTRAIDENIPERAKKYVANKHVFFSNISYKHIVHNNNLINISDIKNENIVAYSGIANNNSFKTSLTDFGAKISYFKALQDHKAPSEQDIELLLENHSKMSNFPIITTEKDYVKIPKKYKNHFSYIKIDININDKEHFYNILIND